MPIAALAILSPLDKATGNRVPIYVSSANDRRVTGLNGVLWEPAMTAPPSLAIALWNGDFKSEVDTGGASFTINMEVVKQSFPNVDSYHWAAAPVEIYAEEIGTAWPWRKLFSGKAKSYARRSQSFTITAEVDTEPHEKNILTATYAGTGGAEGGADLKNQPKPLVIGQARNVEPVLIDTVNSVYQFSGYGAIESVLTLYERGSSFGAAVADYASYTALVAATIPPGRWATCLAEGMIRLGAPAYGVITADLKGHKVGASTPRLTGAIISALATIAGVPTANINAASLTALDTAVPYTINLVLTDQVTWRDMAQRLALACNWQSGISFTGEFFASSVSLGASQVVTLDAQGRAVPLVTQSEEIEVSAPYWKTTLGANRCWRVHSSEEIAFNSTIIDRGRYDSATTYREGNVVDTEDGARWIYVAATASSNNAPPTYPTTSNSWWSMLTPPGISISGYLTNEATTFSADSSGVVSNFSAGGGTFKVFEGRTDRTTAATFSVVSATGCTVTINASTGVYAVTGMSANTATAVLRADYKGVSTDKTLTLSKSLAGSSAKAMWIVSDRQSIAYDGAGSPTPSTQTTTLSAVKQNASSAVTWTVADATGAAMSPVGNYLSSAACPPVTNWNGNSERFDQGNYLKTNATITADAIAAPDGTTTADKLVETASATTQHYLRTSSLGTRSGTFTVSVCAKAGERSIISLYMDNGGGTSVAFDFDLTSQTTTQRALASGWTDPVASMVDLGGGWFRCILTATRATSTTLYARVSLGAAGATYVVGQPTYTGDGTSGLYLWGLQVEQGAFTFYVPTPANSSVTSSAWPTITGDTVTMTEAQFASARNGTSGVTISASLVDTPAINDKISVVRVQAGANGANGTNGNNVAQVYAYKRAATAPTDNPGAVTFDFATGTISTATLANSWSKTIPTGTNPLYVTVASASSSTSTDSIAAGEWSSPVLLAQNGANGTNGTDGLNVATVFLYRRTTTAAAPSVTTTGSATYTFASGGITGQPSGWSTAVPSSGGGFLWVIQATAAATTATDTIANTEWSAPVQITQDGTPAISGYVTNEAIQLPAYADGSVISYAPAAGTFKVFSGDVNVSSSFTLGTFANPQALSVTYTGQNYSITGGFLSSVDSASLTIRATGSGAYAGITIDKVVSLAKAKGGYEIVSTLPTTNLFPGRMVFLTTDALVYRYVTGTGWTANIPAAQISGTLTATQIASLPTSKLTGTLGADLFAANTIIASNIVAMDFNNLISDPNFADYTAGGTYWSMGSYSVVTSGAAVDGMGVIAAVQIDGTSAPSGQLYQAYNNYTRIAVEPGKPYRLYCLGRVSGAFTGRARFGVRWFDKNGVQCATGGLTLTEAIGGSDYRAAAPGAATNLVFEKVFTAPTDAAYARVTFYTDFSTTLTNVGYAYYAAPRMMRAMNSELVVDGTIKANHVDITSLDAITANVGVLTAGTIRNVSDTHRIDVTAGRTITKVGSYMKVTGAAFGSSNQFIEWYGPYFASLSSCTEANAIYYLRSDGSAYFGGSLLSGVLKNEGTASDTSATASVVIGPFGSNGGSRVVTASFSYRYFANITNTLAYTGSASATFVLERWNGTSYTQIGTSSPGGTITGANGNGAGDPGYIEITINGSMTVTDTTGGSSAQYRVRLTSRTLPSITSTITGTPTITQRVSCISVEN